MARNDSNFRYYFSWWNTRLVEVVLALAGTARTASALYSLFLCIQGSFAIGSTRFRI